MSAATPAAVEPTMKPRPPRLMSLDALRGFDMFWIIGGAAWVRAIAASVHEDYGKTAEYLTEHPEWNGYTPYDQIFPMFMFIAGAAIPFSVLRHLEEGQSKAKLARM